jgi:precorrin-3B synthase
MPEIHAQIAKARQAVAASACPGLFRIVPARDGGICRLKTPLGQLSSHAARAVAAAAGRFGNGGIDVTNRANLQLRGISPEQETPLIAALLEAGLGPTRPEADDIRNVMVSPVAGIDPAQVVDALPLARDLLDRLQADDRYATLSPKFCILVDGGESVAAIDHPHDIWLASTDGKTVALGLAGCPPLDAGDTIPFVTLDKAHVSEVVIAALDLFLEEAARDAEIKRIRNLLARITREQFFERLSGKVAVTLRRDAIAASWRRKAPSLLGHVGIHAQRQESFVFIGAVPPLGRLSPRTLGQLADIVDEHGDGSLRLTPWQSVLVPFVRRETAPAAMRALEAAGFICDPDQPLASIVACSGATGCASALSDTKADAVQLARALADGGKLPGLVHFTGCAKSCASAGVADFTMLAAAPGTYALYRKSAAGPDKFGQAIDSMVGIEQAGTYLRKDGSAPFGGATKGKR